MIKQSLLLVGCGKMGGALLEGFLAAGLHPERVTVIEQDAEIVRSIKKRYGVNAQGGLGKKDKLPDIVLFAVKPQTIQNILPDYKIKGKQGGKPPLYVSIIAGKPVSFFTGILGPVPFVRTMPNLPVLVKQGVTVAFGNTYVAKGHKTILTQLFGAVGKCHWIEDESLLDAVTAISGSGPAYVFHFLEALEAAAQQLGLPPALAYDLARSTLLGSADLAKQSTQTAAGLRQQVTSPKGTTEAALEILMHRTKGLTALLSQAAEAAKKRSEELARG